MYDCDMSVTCQRVRVSHAAPLRQTVVNFSARGRVYFPAAQDVRKLRAKPLQAKMQVLALQPRHSARDLADNKLHSAIE